MSLLTPEAQAWLLRVAREAIRHRLAHQPDVPALPSELPPQLLEKGASFVTLTLHGKLRGCIGTLEAHQPLAVDVQRNAQAAAFRDPRFPPVTEEEFASLNVEVSVLSTPEPLDYDGPQDLLHKLRPGVDGVVLARDWNRATFLPQVWAQLPDPEEFLSHLCRKAGLPLNAWRWADLTIHTYQVEKFSESESETA